MENTTRKVNELLDIAANDYASENIHLDLSAQYSAFIAGAHYVLMFGLDTKADVSEETKNNVIKLLEEDLWCVHKYLDDLELPRTDDKDELYSIVGRIKRLEAKYLKQLSGLETIYLRSNK